MNKTLREEIFEFLDLITKKKKRYNVDASAFRNLHFQVDVRHPFPSGRPFCKIGDCLRVCENKGREKVRKWCKKHKSDGTIKARYASR